MTAITAITSQNTNGVKSIQSITPTEISKQIEFTSKDIKPDAIKIGMLHSVGVINAVLKSLNKIKVEKIILDPVMIAKSGTKLIDNRSIKILKLKLIKKVSLITPNIPEAEILTKTKINSVEDMVDSAKILMSLGAKNVLIKGGHLKSKIMQDIFLNKNEIFAFKNKKIHTKNTHGTGCTLSSAIATYYSCGKTLKKSCEMAIKYVNHSIGTGLRYGKGHGPINHLSVININKKFK
jgi:hydroxymethylpyrimidine/phosphomethylpyrimidine kinase